MMNQLISMFAYILMRPRTSSSISMHDRHPKRLVRDLFTHYNAIFTKDINQAQKSGASRSAIVANNSLFLAVSPPPVPEKDEPAANESALRRTLLNIMHRNSAETLRVEETKVVEEEEEECATPSSASGPLIVPHAKLTLFDDPDHSQPSSPTQHHILFNAGDEIDENRLSTDLMLDMTDEDAVEIDQQRLTTPKKNRSRASTRGTMDNVELDAFFVDE
jgi:hypothetical protein